MKTAKQWVDEHSQSGAFDCINSIADAETLVRAIQGDAMIQAAGIVNAMSRGTASEERAIAIDEARDAIDEEVDTLLRPPA